MDCVSFNFETIVFRSFSTYIGRRFKLCLACDDGFVFAEACRNIITGYDFMQLPTFLRLNYSLCSEILHSGDLAALAAF